MEDQRKIQITGRNTYIISLPHQWIERNQISKGQAVHTLQNDDGTITLSVRENSRELKSVSIVASDSSESTMRNIVSAYVAGAGRLILSGKNISTLAEEARRVLSGVEITDESEKELVLRILTSDDLNLDSVIKRAYAVTNSMFALVSNSFKDGSDVHVEISRKEDDVDRLYLLLLRQICISGTNMRIVLFKAMAAKSIEKISDHLEDLSTNRSLIGQNRELSELISLAQKIFVLSCDSLINSRAEGSDYLRARELFLVKFKSFEEGLKTKKDKSEIIALRSLSEKCIKLLRYCEDIIESSGDLSFAVH
ncbi:phosphate uptake regulator PhoU [Candidatus Micrarchaeota archaeon]|nr:phosphate uptake regulator PhoU [Candidatus Micrarchaeota archaeon]